MNDFRVLGLHSINGCAAGAAPTITAQWSGVGTITHLVVAMSYTNGATNPTDILTNATLNLTLNGKDGKKLIDNFTLPMLASIADHMTGAVEFASSASANGVAICNFALPIGQVHMGATDELVCQIQFTTNGATALATFDCAVGVANLYGAAETGFYRYLRRDLALTSGSQQDATFHDHGIVAIWAYDPASGTAYTREGAIASITVSAEGLGTCTGPRAIFRAASLAHLNMSTVAAITSSDGIEEVWNRAIRVYSTDIIEALDRSVTIVCSGAGTGNVSLLAIVQEISTTRTSPTTIKAATRRLTKIQNLESKFPDKARALRHIGSIPKAADLAPVVHTAAAAQKRRIAGD